MPEAVTARTVHSYATEPCNPHIGFKCSCRELKSRVLTFSVHPIPNHEVDQVLNSSQLQVSGESLRWLGLAVLLGFVLALASAPAGRAQGLGWEGETGVFVTPLAYTASAEGQKIHAVTAYHCLDAGSVIGNFHEASIEVGFLGSLRKPLRV